MNDKPEQPTGSNRREFLSGKAVRQEIEQAGERLADEMIDEKTIPETSETVRLATRAMACEFSVIMNPSQNRRQVISASDALDCIHEIETSLTVYRETSELLELNRKAQSESVKVGADLFALLKQSLEIAQETEGAFTPTVRALNQLWRQCKSQSIPPEPQAVKRAVQESNYRDVYMDSETQSIRFEQAGLGFDLSGIGKGYALDCAAEHLKDEGIEDFLFHGGHSSILVQGNHTECEGWPVGIRHPLFQQKRLATLMLNNCGYSSSGSGVQFFRHQGKKYGHLFDPRTGWSVSHMLSVAVIAPTAAIADALSTAFYVMSIDQAKAYCKQHPEVSTILIPQPAHGTRLEPICIGISKEEIYWEE
ncbi:MAG: FAD:protein FMN transferase [Planctomycetaceae bacterium]|nr:FAD:protein FMN transferase [Planctomycetaceae bacterium]MBL4885894.1 FAD:protein FMN transferase [Planctomycetaceae bacterium]